jgi:hypothetical protein
MKYTEPDYDPKLSPERNAEIAEWAKRNYETMQLGKTITHDTKRFNFGEMDFDEDCVTDE